MENMETGTVKLGVGVHVRMPATEVDAVRLMAISNGYSFSGAVRQLIRIGLATATK